MDGRNLRPGNDRKDVLSQTRPQRGIQGTEGFI
jgi:hypothetical protein